ncbi:hypothetical protein G9A89_015258 [Geosiphon pyriformis]|nr:hypothetical protein G9A89_015258 [Geosiphon pyriformis]
MLVTNFLSNSQCIRLPLERHCASGRIRKYKPIREQARFFGGEFHSTIEVGDPGQTFHVLFDTGSTPIWVPYQSCNTTHAKFISHLSDTYEKIGVPWEIAYADNDTAAGFFAKETITIGRCRVKNQIVSLATVMAGTFDEEPIDGVFGLGFGCSIKGKPYRSMIENMKHQNLITQQRFAVWYGKHESSQFGEISIGDLNLERFKGRIKYTTMIPNTAGDWKIKIDGVSVLGHRFKKGIEVIVDSGNVGIDLPQSVVDKVHEQISATRKDESGQWFIPSIGNFTGSFAILFNGKKLTVPFKDLVGEEVEDMPGYCCSLLAPQPGEIAYLGSTFIQNWYTIFDFDNKRIGFAKSVP